jgi:hypothetical protein
MPSRAFFVSSVRSSCRKVDFSVFISIPTETAYRQSAQHQAMGSGQCHWQMGKMQLEERGTSPQQRWRTFAPIEKTRQRLSSLGPRSHRKLRHKFLHCPSLTTFWYRLLHQLLGSHPLTKKYCTITPHWITICWCWPRPRFYRTASITCSPSAAQPTLHRAALQAMDTATSFP